MAIDATTFGIPTDKLQSRTLAATATVVPNVDDEPITLQQAKDHLRVVIPDEDDYISALIVAARQMAEGKLNRTLKQRSLTARFTASDTRYWLRKPPIVSLDSVTAIDAAYAQTPVDTYTSVDSDDSVEIHATMPYNGALLVTYTAGYAAGEVPAPIVQWMKIQIGTMYEQREAVGAGVQLYAIPNEFIDLLIQPYMVYE